jgi:DNA-binding HxlR family transcriptional regulator
VNPERKPSRRVCSITDALSIVGDRYALLVARELRYGQTRFEDMAASTGAPATSSPHGCASSNRPA